MLEYICYGCIGTYYFSFCAFAGYTCYIERREAQDARIREYQHINQQNPPNDNFQDYILSSKRM